MSRLTYSQFFDWLDCRHYQRESRPSAQSKRHRRKILTTTSIGQMNEYIYDFMMWEITLSTMECCHGICHIQRGDPSRWSWHYKTATGSDRPALPVRVAPLHTVLNKRSDISIYLVVYSLHHNVLPTLQSIPLMTNDLTTYTITASEESFEYKDVKTVFTLKWAPLIRFVPAEYTGLLSQHMCCWETNVVGTWLEETQNHNRAARYYYQNFESTGISSRHYRVSCQWVTRLSGQHKLISFITILFRTVQKLSIWVSFSLAAAIMARISTVPAQSRKSPGEQVKILS